MIFNAFTTVEELEELFYNYGYDIVCNATASALIHLTQSLEPHQRSFG